MGGRLVAVLGLALHLGACGSGARHVAIPNGRHFGFVVRIAADRSIAFDETEFLVGEEAQRAAEAAGAVSPGEPVSNDYFIRNPNRSTTTLRVARGVRVTVVRCPTSCREGFRSRLGALETGADHPPYWVTTADGVVTRIDQQYVP